MVNKVNHVTMLIACDMGGITGGTAATLHRLSKNAAEGRDGTVYGVHSGADFYTHHATAISLAIVTATAEVRKKLTLRPHAVGRSPASKPRDRAHVRNTAAHGLPATRTHT